MNFNRSDLFLYLVPFFIFFLFLILRQENKFFKWIKSYWFYSRSFTNRLASFSFIIGIFLLTISLADLRGKEEVIKGKVAQKKTLILVDSSASMLAEDVRPNRYKKALLLAKHYLKKAVGEQVSIVVFSDKQKRIVPFTTDMNLIDARVGTLEKLDLRNGGSNIALALREAEKYFIGPNGISIGNILLLTDGEDNEKSINVQLDDKITLATVGIGTAKGATIPLRDNRGMSRGVKRFNGQPVTTKLDEGFLKNIGADVKNYRYWIASSYSLPTEEIQRFFERSYKSKMSEGEVRIKPVKYETLLIPSFLFLILSTLLRFSKSFVYVSVFCLISLHSVYAQAPIDKSLPKQEEPQKSDEVLELEEKFATGRISEVEKKKLAQKLLQEGFPKESSTLYGELLNDVDETNALEHLNKGVADFQAGKVGEGIKTYNKLIDYLEENDPEGELSTKVKKNLFKALQQVQQQKSKSQNNQDQNQDQQNQDQQNQDQQNQDQQNQNQDQQNQNQQNNQQQNNQQQNNQDQQNQKQNNQDQKDKDEKDKNGKDKDKKDKDQNKGKKERDKEKNDPQNGDSGKKKKKKKIPALLKQLISDDNQLQKDAIDAQTKDRKKRNRKDW